jgi:hypothetical protein
MRAVNPGHGYELDSFEGNSKQFLRFIHREKQSPDPADFVTVENGTTNEEVLAMLIDRLQYLQAKAPCRENAIVITKLEEALMWLNKRTADRKARGVEGTAAK